MRPTGKLHLGNYMGALANWVKLQDSGQYECYFFVADLHALTTDYADTSNIAPNTREVALDFLAAGLDPQKCTIFVQSRVKQHYELPMFLGMITPLSWLERVPSYKEMQENLTSRDLTNYGFLGYPVLMASDILLYQANFVPVGQDQRAHVELTREIARRFNFFYADPGRPAKPISSEEEANALIDLEKELAEESVLHRHKGTYMKDSHAEGSGTPAPVLVEPAVLLTHSPKLPGTDGRKMSKSYGNTIGLTDSPRLVSEKLAKMWNGGQRGLVSEPGDPERCPVYDLHKLFSSDNILRETGDGCRNATISCTECKQFAALSTSRHLRPIQSKRTEYELRPNDIEEILQGGAEKAARRAEETMVEVREAMGISKVSPFSRLTVFEQYSYDTSQPMRHSLENHKDLWNETSEKVEKFLVEYWKTGMVPSDCVLKQAEDGFVTNRKKRIFTSAAQEGNSGWHFRIPARSFEVWALICWDQSFFVNDFIIPQKFFAQPFAQIKKNTREKEIHVRVWKFDEKWSLTFEGLNEHEEIGHEVVIHVVDPIDVTELISNYDPLR
jgi:tryptophanyl-tRNA synthetase